MKRLFPLLVMLLIYGCNPSDKSTNSLLELVPENTDVVLTIYDLENTRSDIRNNDLINNLLTIPPYDVIYERLEDLNTTDSIVLWMDKTNDSLSYSFATRLKDSLFINGIPDSLQFPNTVIDSFFIGSSSGKLLDMIQPQANEKLRSLLNASDGDKPFSIILRNNPSNRLGEALLKDFDKGFSNESLIETQINSEEVLFSGVTYANDSISQLLRVFENNFPQETTIQNVAPGNADGILSFTYNDFQQFSEALQPYRSRPLDSLFNSELFQTISEVGEIYFEEGSLLSVKTIDGQATREALRNHLEVQSTYRTIDIIAFGEPELFIQVFDPFIKAGNLNYYAELGDFFVFGPTEESIQNTIAAYQNGTTLGASSAYQACASQLGDASSLTLVCKSDKLKTVLSGWFNNSMAAVPTGEYQLSAFQFVQDIGFSHFNGVIKKHRQRDVTSGISEVFSTELEADIIMPPQFVINHRTKQRDIVVQDVNNNLYLISNTGRILWKKKLIGNVLGRIEQVDLYRNGRLQLAFATPYRVYVIDRNGNHVSPFPMKFGERITQPLSVFDYDNNRRFRFLVTQDNDLLMYDRNARFVRGFQYSSSLSVKTQPKHFRIGNKDYIVFGAGKRFRILNRRGTIRVGVQEQFEFSGNPVFLYRNTFLTTTADGQLVQIDQQGKVKRSDLNLSEDHKIFATSKTLVTLDENELDIKQKSVELDFGQYTEPRIHYINDKIYVSCTDLQSQKAYLFDSQAEPIENFPVYGNSTLDLDNADADRNLEFIVRGETNTIVMYKKN
ncbi:MAG: ribonuclease HII [Flavobacteriaceae bacterium]|nr:ribonuclease HII [Flavobacteriaceae bacterium]